MGIDLGRNFWTLLSDMIGHVDRSFSPMASRSVIVVIISMDLSRKVRVFSWYHLVELR